MDLLIPIARRIPLVMNGEIVPYQMRGHTSGVARGHEDIEEYAHAMGGKDVKPTRPLVVWGPDGTSIIIMGGGVAEASEIRDVAHDALERAEQRTKKTGRSFDFNSARERERLPRREDVDAMIRDAMRRRAQQHIANPITDPARVPLRGDK